MAQNVTIAGAQYSDVPAIDLPKTGGGTARFYDPQGNKALTPTLAAQTNVDVKTFATASVAAITKELLASLDSDFVAGNIKQGVDLFGLVGTLESEGGILLPAGAKISAGSYTPSESGIDVKHKIKVAQQMGTYPYKNVLVFAIYRSDGLFADGSSDTRYIRSYFGASEKGGYGCGFVQYRNNASSGESNCAVGVETPSSKNCGVPNTGNAVRSNTIVRYVGSDGELTVSSYGIICLEPAKEYKWFAIIEEGAEL